MRSGCAFIGALLLAAAALPQTFDLEKALALPVSPGAIALLIEHTGDDRVRARLAEHLQDGRSEVRAAAARVIHAASVQALVPNVTEALGTEADADAATEMVMAVTGHAESERVVLDAARRLRIESIAASALAAGGGIRALEYLDVLRESEPRLPLAPVLRIASRDDLAALTPVAAKALREPDLVLWKAYLEAARESNQEVSGGLLSVGVALEDLNSATLWHALASGAKLSVPPETVLDGEEEFLVELLARREGRKPRESKPWIAARAAGDETLFREIREPRFNNVLLILTKNERRALSSQIRKDAKALDSWYERATGEKANESPEERRETTAMLKTISDFPDGFVASLLDTTGCKPMTMIGIQNAEVQFSLTGRPVRVRFNPIAIESIECHDASRALILNSIITPRALSPKASWDSLLVLVEPDFFRCLSEVASASSGLEAVRVGRDLEAPKKIADFSPVYPPSARQSRVQGLVVLESVITTSGCVRGLRAVQSPDTRLALASIVAVSHWRYEPTRLNGVPVPIVMTVTVNFALN